MDLHAHIDSYTTDCDGPISRSWIEVPNDTEQTDEFGDIHFHQRVVSLAVSTYSIAIGGTLEVTRWDDGSVGFDWSEQTEEGSRYVNARICDDPSCDTEKSSYRDHRAESMGY